MKNNAKATESSVALIDEQQLKNKIYTIRGIQVMLDTDLASLYEVETKVINRAVKRNERRFPPDFYFSLSAEEWQTLRFQIGTSNIEGRGGRRYCPYVFTEQGVSMLSSVLHSDVAIDTSIAIMRTFVKMRQVLARTFPLSENQMLQLSMQLNQHSVKIGQIEDALNNFATKDDLEKLQGTEEFFKCRHFLILNGQKLEADLAYTQIYGIAKSSILIVDNYVGVKTLDLLRGVAKNVKVTILGDQRGRGALTPQIVADFKAARPDVELELKPGASKFHDRYILLDSGQPGGKLFHCGASSKDAGNKITTIMEIENAAMYHDVF